MAIAYSAMGLQARELKSFVELAENLLNEGKATEDDLQLLRSSTDVPKGMALAKAGNQKLQQEITITAVISRVRASYSVEANEAKLALREEREAH